MIAVLYADKWSEHEKRNLIIIIIEIIDFIFYFIAELFWYFLVRGFVVINPHRILKKNLR